MDNSRNPPKTPHIGVTLETGDRRALKSFGRPLVGQTHYPRAGGYGILARDGRIAMTKIGRLSVSYIEYEVPGGGIDEGESAEQACVREFLEETGLLVKVGRKICEFNQFYGRRGEQAYLNHSHVFEVEWVADRPSAKIEADHELVWMSPLEVIKLCNKEGFAWAVVSWLRHMRDA